jgi:hypothetical protein
LGKEYTHTTGQNMPPNTDHTHEDLHDWTIIRNFSEIQFNAPWWWFLRDPKNVGVDYEILKYFK